MKCCHFLCRLMPPRKHSRRTGCMAKQWFLGRSCSCWLNRTRTLRDRGVQPIILPLVLSRIPYLAVKGVFEVPLPWCRVSSCMLMGLLHDAPPKVDDCWLLSPPPSTDFGIFCLMPAWASPAWDAARKMRVDARKYAAGQGHEKPGATNTLPARPLLKGRQYFYAKLIEAVEVRAILKATRHVGV